MSALTSAVGRCVGSSRTCVRYMSMGLAPPSNTKFIEYADVHHTTGRSRPVDPSKYKSAEYYSHGTFSYYQFEIDMLKKRTIKQANSKIPDTPRDCTNTSAK